MYKRMEAGRATGGGGGVFNSIFLRRDLAVVRLGFVDIARQRDESTFRVRFPLHNRRLSEEFKFRKKGSPSLKRANPLLSIVIWESI